MILILIASIVGALFGVGGTFAYERRKIASGRVEREKDLADASREAAGIVLKAKDEALKMDNERRKEWKRTEDRLAEREQVLDKKFDSLDNRAEKMRTQEGEIEELKDEIHKIRSRQQEKLEKIAGLKKSEAAEKLMQMTERDIKKDLVGLLNKLQNDIDARRRGASSNNSCHRHGTDGK